ncbi:aminotransferase class V-fold PLP-dependent enzyme [Luxibacter massiliensis]|uniref:aminotransferase class V-fold PLP-dependent enzyme n=1 Tax=Luxibacter massiliensis TaxID=2219695 RepID=UPI000F05D93A|nr:aminotransferase class V-fold PLP-dependent enzyme [Luxibacter massiliensis]
MEQIYFDNGSTSFPKAPGMAEAVYALLQNGAFNINRGGYEGAYEVADKVLETREMLARMFHAESSRQVVFTPGITYSVNYLLKGLLKKGDHVIVSGMEHNAVMRPLAGLADNRVTYSQVPADYEGTITPRDVEEEIHKHPNTRLVLMVHASNVCGTVLPIEEIGPICRRKGIFFAVDTAQSAGSLDIDMKKCAIDFLAFTGHKGLLGPQGIGGFLITERLDHCMRPVIEGGTGSSSDKLEQPETLPDKYESGTMNLPGIIGLHASLAYLEERGPEAIHQKKMELTMRFLDGLKEIPQAKVAGRLECQGRTAVVAVDFEGMDNALLAFELEQEYGIMTRVGLQCAPEAHKSLGTFPQGTVRFSFSGFNTVKEIETCLQAIAKICRRDGI